MADDPVMHKKEIINIATVTTQHLKENLENIVQLANQLKAVLNELPGDCNDYSETQEPTYVTERPGGSNESSKKVRDDKTPALEPKLNILKVLANESNLGTSEVQSADESNSEYTEVPSDDLSTIRVMEEQPIRLHPSDEYSSSDQSQSDDESELESHDVIEVHSDRSSDKEPGFAASHLMEIHINGPVQMGCRHNQSKRFPQRLFLINLVLYILDVGTDVALGVVYCIGGHIWWGIGTMFFVIGTLVVTNTFSIFYCRDQIKKLRGKDPQRPYINHRKLGIQESEEHQFHSDGPWFIMFVVMHIFQLGLLFRIIYALFHKSDVDQEKKMYDVIRVLRLLGSFIESGPQLVLQIFILEHHWSQEHDGVVWITAATILASFASFLSTVRVHYKHFTTYEKENHPWLTETALVTSLLLTIASRVIALALVASLFAWTVFVIVGCHCLVILGEAYYYTARYGFKFRLKPHLLTCYVTLFIYTCVENRSFLGKFPWMFDILLFIETALVYMAWYITAGFETEYGVPVAVFVFGGYILGAILKLNLFDYKRLSKYITLEYTIDPKRDARTQVENILEHD